MLKPETKYNEYDEHDSNILDIVNSINDINILIDKLIILLIKIQDEGKDYDETNQFINKCITLSNQSIDEIFNWLKEKQNESKYIFFLGFFYYNNLSLEENNDEGFKSFLKAAKDNYPIAQVYLGICYHEGFGTEINDGLAFNWMQKAAENESIIGQNILAYYY